jgi:hypothetical protein
MDLQCLKRGGIHQSTDKSSMDLLLEGVGAKSQPLYDNALLLSLNHSATNTDMEKQWRLERRAEKKARRKAKSQEGRDPDRGVDNASKNSSDDQESRASGGPPLDQQNREGGGPFLGGENNTMAGSQEVVEQRNPAQNGENNMRTYSQVGEEERNRAKDQDDNEMDSGLFILRDKAGKQLGIDEQWRPTVGSSFKDHEEAKYVLQEWSLNSGFEMVIGSTKKLGTGSKSMYLSQTFLSVFNSKVSRCLTSFYW